MACRGWSWELDRVLCEKGRAFLPRQDAASFGMRRRPLSSADVRVADFSIADQARTARSTLPGTGVGID